MPSFNTSQSQQQGRSRSRQQTRVIPQLFQEYRNLLAKNTENYQNIQNAYTQAQTNTASMLNNAYGGYNALEGRVLGTLQGQGQTQYELNRRAFEQTQGRTQQSLINAGLGNSTIGGALSSQNTLNYGLANTATTEALMRQVAGAQQGIGLARQGAMMQGTGMQANLAGQYMGDLAGYHFTNTMGNLTGGFGRSQSDNSGLSSAYGQAADLGGGGGGRGGMGPIPGEPYTHHAVQNPIGGLGYGDVSMGGGLYQPGYSPGGFMGGGGISMTPTPESGYSPSGYAGAYAPSGYDIYRNNAVDYAGR